MNVHEGKCNKKEYAPTGRKFFPFRVGQMIKEKVINFVEILIFKLHQYIKSFLKLFSYL